MIRIFLLILALAGTCARAASDEPIRRQPFDFAQGLRDAGGTKSAPKSEDLRQLLERMISAMHRADAEDALVARTEHWAERRHAADADPMLDRVYRVYPTGTGTLKLVVEERGTRVAPEKFREELRGLEQTLVWALDPEESAQHERVEKFRKRSAERYRAVEGFRDSYELTWQGEEKLGGRSVQKLLLDPKPSAASGSVATELLAASRLTVWVDPDTAGVVQMDAELVRDLLFGGGLLGKIDKGGHVHIEQEQIEPGVWLPKLTRYEVQGRKLFVHEQMNRTIDDRDFLRVGPPADLLAAVRRELNNAQLKVPAP